VIRSHEEHYLQRAVSIWLQSQPSRSWATWMPNGCPIVSFVCALPAGDTSTTTSSLPCSTTCSGSRPARLLVRRPLRTPPAGHRPRPLTGVRPRDSSRVRGHQARLDPVSFNYFISETVFAYIVEAVRLVSKDGWRLLGDYRFEPATGLWKHRRGPAEPPLRLDQVTYDEQGESVPRHHDRASESELHRYLEEARNLLQAATPVAGEPVGDLYRPTSKQLRWFDLPPACLSDTTA